MRKWMLSFTLALVTCLGLTVTALAAGDPADVSEPNYVTGSWSDTIFSAVVDENHALWVKGYNRDGRLGTGTESDSESYVKIMDNVASVASIEVGSVAYFSVAAVKTDGSLWTWGNNVDSRLGYANSSEEEHRQLTPRKVMDGVAAASATSQGILAIKTDGSLWLLAKEHKKIADNVIYATEMDGDCVGYITTDRNSWFWSSEDGSVSFILPDARAFGGDYTGYVLKTDNTLWALGDNHYYQLGNGTQTDAAEWVKLMDDVASFRAADEGIGVVKTNGELWVWGANHRVNDTQASYGLQNISCQSVPVKVSENVKAIAVGGYVTIKPDGTVHTWKNTDSQYAIVKRGYFDVKLTDIITPVAAPSGTASGTTGRFEDVHTTDYFYDAVNWAVEKGITSGKSETRFAPYDTCTVGEAIIFLWRAAGQPEPTIAPEFRFTNLEEDDYRYKPYNWSLNTVYPRQLHKFGSTGAGCLRIAIVNMLWYLNGRPEPSSAQGTFTDVSWSDSLTAKAVIWAVEKGITSGTGDGTTFSPNEQCTRAQVVTFLHRAFAE
ncbi:MAG: hypothetical protein HDT14_02990 [Oscillibacter sp.]|nr:hypothetical protein [Oscillibacter sp.]